ncbi:MAG TPA: hypothetical protein VGX72_10130 [Solirubrobacteraceae bacterium]|nr:hypothetical protein [Solirubrobacteraceae bacterium]
MTVFLFVATSRRAVSHFVPNVVTRLAENARLEGSVVVNDVRKVKKGGSRHALAAHRHQGNGSRMRIQSPEHRSHDPGNHHDAQASSHGGAARHRLAGRVRRLLQSSRPVSLSRERIGISRTNSHARISQPAIAPRRDAPQEAQ